MGKPTATAMRVHLRATERLSSFDWKVWIDESGWRVRALYLKSYRRRPQDSEPESHGTAFVGVDVTCRAWTSWGFPSPWSESRATYVFNRWPERMADDWVDALLKWQASASVEAS